MTNKSNNKQFVALLGGIAISLAIASLVLSLPFREIFAQETNSTQPNPMQTEIPQLNGSVSVQQQANEFIEDNVQVPFSTALESAQAEIGNGTVISGRLGVVQGYLVYIFKVANFDAETSHIVIVDAGNGAVLYTSGDMPLQFGGLRCGAGAGASGHHEGFGNHWGNHDRGGTSDSNSSQPSRSAVVVSPAIGV